MPGPFLTIKRKSSLFQGAPDSAVEETADRLLPCCGISDLVEENPGHSEKTHGPGCRRHLPENRKLRRAFEHTQGKGGCMYLA